MSEDSFVLDTPGDLGNLVEKLAVASCVAVDTEFVWERTFYARLGLIQLGTADGTCHLIDTIAVTDLTPLAKILESPTIVKILHDAPQDLTILRRATGAIPLNIFDTRVAAGFAGLSSETSLQNLLADLLDIQLPKGHTRTDWTARPLSPGQLEYAADDVRHLPRAASLLRQRARDAGVEAWLDEEMDLLNSRLLTDEPDPREAYRRIRPGGRLRPRNLAVLRELAAWREQEARTVDLPRQHVIEDTELMSVATVLPSKPVEFEKCRDLRRRTEQRYGTSLLAAVQQGMTIPESDCPVPPVTPDERIIGKERITALSEAIRKTAEAKAIDPRLVHTKNDLLMLLHDKATAQPKTHRLLRGWRAELLRDFLATLA